MLSEQQERQRKQERWKEDGNRTETETWEPAPLAEAQYLPSVSCWDLSSGDGEAGKSLRRSGGKRVSQN